MNAREVFQQDGWCRFARDPALLAWVEAVRETARDVAQDPKLVAEWLRCGNTWFAGVNALPNDAKGRVGGGAVLSGDAVAMIERLYGPLDVDRAQISVIYPGYPRPMEGESPAAFRFRRDRDAAHVDGLLPVGPTRRRHVMAPHSYVLGIPLVETSVGASPMTVWQGSHLIMRQAFLSALADVPPQEWRDVDLTDTYQAARRTCFEQCARVIIQAQPGEAYLIHRLTLHGVARWEDGAVAPEEGRMIAYFRPELEDMSRWLA